MNDPLLHIALLMVFIAVFAAIEGGLAWWRGRFGAEARRMTQRLAMLAGDAPARLDASALKRRQLSRSVALTQALMASPICLRLERFLVQTGTPWVLTRVCAGSALLAAGGVCVMLFAHRGLLSALMVGGALAAAPWGYLHSVRARRLSQFERQLPDALDLISRALQAGHALPSALQMAGQELGAPVGPAFAQTFDEINFGAAVPNALHNLARRVPIPDLGFFVIAVLIQRESGGNLAEVLTKLAGIIRGRALLRGKVEALSAEGRFSGLVLSVLPFGTGGLLYLVDPNFVALLWQDESGFALLRTGLLFMVLGALWMRQLVRIRV